MLEYGGFRLYEKKGNNVFSYDEREPEQKKIWIPKLIEGKNKIELGNMPCFFEQEHKEIKMFFGLKNFYFFPGKNPIYIFDNHNHALAFRYREYFKGYIKKGINLIHIDQHSDMNTNENQILNENREDIISFTNNDCNVGNFIIPAINAGLISDVKQLRTEQSILSHNSTDNDYILDIDLDFLAPEMSITDTTEIIKKIKNLIKYSKLTTIATSPYFLNQNTALEILNEII